MLGVALVGATQRIVETAPAEGEAHTRVNAMSPTSPSAQRRSGWPTFMPWEEEGKPDMYPEHP